MPPHHPPRMSQAERQRRKRRSFRTHSNCDDRSQDPENWRSAVKEVLGDIRASSPTLRAFRENGARLRESYEALRRALARAQHKQRTPKSFLGHGQQGVPTDISKLLKDVGSKEESNLYAAGALVFGFGLFLAGAAPWLLPACFLLFAALCLPWRAYSFAKRKWSFFLLDFCYWGNLAAVGFLIIAPNNRQLEAMVYALTDGPLAAALMAWQSAWVFGSTEHSISVLIHLLPGLALFAHRHCTVPEPWMHAWQYVTNAAAPASDVPADNPVSFFWISGAPLLFYAAWQLMYFFIVQVCCRGFIQRNGYDTSYNALARRAAKNNNVWNRIVRKGSILRRVCMYGLIQAVFTVCVLVLFIPVYYNFYIAFLWQVAKVVFPVYYGAKYQCEKVPKHAVIKALRAQRAAQAEAQRAAHADMSAAVVASERHSTTQGGGKEACSGT